MNDTSENPEPCAVKARSVSIRTRKGSFLLGVIFTATIVLILQVGLYLYSFASRPSLAIVSDRIDLNRIMQHDSGTFWSLQPNLKNVAFQAEPAGQLHDFHVSTNELGLRNPPLREKGGRLRILAIGDSTTFGQYVEDAETWPAQLQNLLDPGGSHVEVINAGLIGATSFQGFSYLLTRGFDLKPDVVLATYGFNDLGEWDIADRCVSPLIRRTALSTMINALVQRGVQGGVTHKPTHASRVSAGEFLDVLMLMAAECESRGVKFYFLVWPDPSQVSGDWSKLSPTKYDSLVFEAAFRSAIKTIDLRRAFHDAPEPVLLDCVHASPAGCRITAECVASALRADLPRLQASLE